MDGDLRYISLQYIKGDNYEEITCFNYGKIMKLLGDDEVADADAADAVAVADAADAVAVADAADVAGVADEKVKQKLKESALKLYFELIEAKEEEKCKIGETFLNDLVNYYNFKDIKKFLIKAKKTTELFIIEDKKNSQADEKQKINKERLQLLDKINSVLSSSVKEKLKETLKRITLKPVSDDINDEKRKKIKDLLIELTGDSTGDSTGYSISNIKEALNKATDSNTFKQKKEELNEALYKDLQESATNLLDAINKYYNEKNEDNDENVDTKLQLFKNKLNELHKNLFQYIKDKQKELDDKKEGFDNLMRLYNTYIKYCKINMEKYENLFKYNEISNIDEAFMIESYSKFLKKLRKLKENLESKDTGKTKRLLVDSFNKLFHKYGIDPNKTLSDTDIEYITNLILQ
jgi:hypothetical protein